MAILFCLKKFRHAGGRCASLWLPITIYLLFIVLVLNISFPLRSTAIIGNNIPSNDAKPDALVEKADAVILSDSDNDGKNLLKVAFTKADTNGDGELQIQELAKYINARVREHVTNAIQTNPFLFAEIDIAPRDGLITWDEYFVHFRLENGLPAKGLPNSLSPDLDRKIKIKIARDKAKWSDAARTDPLSLSLDEFLSFRHPESSAANLLGLVDDLLRQFDLDGDEKLTMDEFSNNENNDDSDGEKKKHPSSVNEKQEEFKRLIDKDGDGIGNRRELLQYVDPRHPRHALQEAATLLALADTNKNGKLSLAEILRNPQLFLDSKMINTSASFDDDG